MLALEVAGLGMGWGRGEEEEGWLPEIGTTVFSGLLEEPHVDFYRLRGSNSCVLFRRQDSSNRQLMEAKARKEAASTVFKGEIDINSP